MPAGIAGLNAQQVNDYRKQCQVNQFDRTYQEKIDALLRQVGANRKNNCHDGRRCPDCPRGQTGNTVKIRENIITQDKKRRA